MNRRCGANYEYVSSLMSVVLVPVAPNHTVGVRAEFNED